MARHLHREPYHHYTAEEYFALERASDRRYEYWNGEIVCMSGGTLAHAQISRNTFKSIDRKLEGRGCQVFTADLAIKTPTLSPYRYADTSVVCGEAQVEEINGIDVLLNPMLIVEVLSPTTEDRDRNEKRIAYQAIPSLREYLLVSQDIPHITHYTSQGDAWQRTDYSTTERIECPSIGIALTLDEVYQGVTFE